MSKKVPVLIFQDRDKLVLEPGMRLTVGRSPEQDLQINEDYVSRKHAEFHFDDAGILHVRDVGTNGSGSRNGTYVDGEQNYGHFEEVLSGYEISLGNPNTESHYTIVYHAKWSPDQERSREKKRSIDDTVIGKKGEAL